MTSTASPAAERADLIRALGVLCERPDSDGSRVAESVGLTAATAAEHTDLFVHQLPPYASIYLDSQGKIGGEARDRVAGFWRAMQMTPPAEPDHLAALFGLWATIIEAMADEPEPERRTLLEHSQRMLVWEHLVSWLTPYLVRVAELSGAYQDWAELTAAAVREKLPDDGGALPTHLAVPGAGLAGEDDLVAYLLTPIRSGLIVTRADLHRAASALGLGLRVGERAFSLRSLLRQGRGSVLGWIAEEAGRQAREFESSRLESAVVQVWSSRARLTSEALRDVLR